MTTEVRWGLFGGSFDPPHNGHLRAALEAAEHLGLERVLLVPANANPLKGRAPEASGAARLAMLRLATAGDPRLVPEGIELEREPPSYTVETLESLAARHPEVRWTLLLGRDAWLGFRAWHRWDAILARAEVAVLARPGYPLPDPAEVLGLEAAAALCYDENDDGRTWQIQLAADGDARVVTVHYLATTPMGISATMIRTLRRAGRSVRYLVPEPVLEYLEAHELYVR